MGPIVELFHLNVGLFLGQVVNFGIIFCVLYFFVFKPLFKAGDDRTKVIEKGLADSEESAKKLEAAVAEQGKILDAAKVEAAAIMKEAKKQADERKDTLIMEAKQEIGKVINQEKQNLQQEKAAVLAEIRAEAADLVVEAARKLLAGSSEIDKAAATKALKEKAEKK
ncbi:MAG: F0F1 ATP synthase subunit B [Candidatus Falkowbacteria bacterium]